MHIILIGNGVAANRAASTIREINKNTNITLISEEIFPLYSACILPNYLSGEINRERVFLKSFEDYSKEKTKTILGRKVVGIDIKNNKIFFETDSLGYDKLIIATGGIPVVPSIEGIDKKGNLTFKTLKDTDNILKYAGKKVVVVGSGPIGVEAAIGLKKKGYGVILIELLGWILPRVFDEKPSLIIKTIMEEQKIKVLTGEKVIKVLGNGKVKGLVTDKRELDCDIIIWSVGIRPNVELAENGGLEIGKLGGIKVNDQLMSSIENIYACGDCIETKDMNTGEETLSLLWHNAKLQGEIVGYNVLGNSKNYPGSQNITGINAFNTHGVSIGNIANAFPHENLEVIERVHDKFYYRLLICKNRLVGAQAIARTEDMGFLLSVMRRKDDITELKKFIQEKKMLSLVPWRHKLNYALLQSAF